MLTTLVSVDRTYASFNVEEDIETRRCNRSRAIPISQITIAR